MAALTDMRTEKVPWKITNVHIGVDGTHGVNIIGGILDFKYHRVHDAKPAHVAKTKTSTTYIQENSHFVWRIELESDCRIAFKATDVVSGGANEYAIIANANSNVIGYFKLFLTIEDTNQVEKTRTITVTNGVALTNGVDIRAGEDAVYWYEGQAEYIDEADT